jgi:hypothetical protein
MKVIERRLAKLEAASALTVRMPVVFICLVPSERALPATATAHGRVWHREPDEPMDAFMGRVAAEARPMRPVARCWRSWINPSLRPDARTETAGTMRIARTGLRATEGNGQSHG